MGQPTDDGTWLAGAACRGRLDLFFAPHAERPQARERREASAARVCFACPVLAPCRAHARAHQELGVWGGETEADRMSIGCTADARG